MRQIFIALLAKCVATMQMPQVMEGFRPVPGSRTMKTVGNDNNIINQQPDLQAGAERAMSPVVPLSAGERMIADDVFASTVVAVEHAWPSRMMRAKTSLDHHEKETAKVKKGKAETKEGGSNYMHANNNKHGTGDSMQTNRQIASLAQDLRTVSLRRGSAHAEAVGVRGWAIKIPLHDDDDGDDSSNDGSCNDHEGDTALATWIRVRTASIRAPHQRKEDAAALRRFEAAALLAGERYFEMERKAPKRNGNNERTERAETDTSSGDGTVPQLELVNVHLHILPGGADAYELDHVAPDHVLPSGIWCVQRKDETKTLEDETVAELAPLTLQLLDPRGDAPNM